MATEVFKYLFFGVLATLVYMVSRTLIFQFTQQGTLSAVLANAIAIIFAFFTNDMFAYTFSPVKTKNLEIIGQFVGHSHAWVNGIESLFSQVLIIVLNYIISKFFVFTGEKV